MTGFLPSDNFAFLVHNKSGPVGYLQVTVGTNPLLFGNSQRHDYQGTSEHHLKLVFKMCRQSEWAHTPTYGRPAAWDHI